MHEDSEKINLHVLDISLPDSGPAFIDLETLTGWMHSFEFWAFFQHVGTMTCVVLFSADAVHVPYSCQGDGEVVAGDSVSVSH